MYISALELFKIGIGPSSSHTMGPMVAAGYFFAQVNQYLSDQQSEHSLKTSCVLNVRCTLKGSLAYTGFGHGTDRAVCLGLHGYSPTSVASQNVDELVARLWNVKKLPSVSGCIIKFSPVVDVIFDKGKPLSEHPNGMIFDLLDESSNILLSKRYFSIGGGFVKSLDEINQLVAPIKMLSSKDCTYGFDSAKSMLLMSNKSKLTIGQMKAVNELNYMSQITLDKGIASIWLAMKKCINNGLAASGTLPGGLDIPRRAKHLHQQLLKHPENANLNDWLCAYAMAVNEENAAGHMVVTAPTNGAAGVIPAILYYFIEHEKGDEQKINEFLLTASAIGGLIKHRSSISGAEVGCQGEVGSAAAMAAAGLCAVKGGNTLQIENAAEIALEHHLGMTCDPVKGLVQVPCIERNGFGAIKAYTAASLALRGDGEHFMPLDQCISAMKQTGLEMSDKFKETSLGGLAVSITEC